ncbi:MAG: DUF2252 family protein [bacterium]
MPENHFLVRTDTIISRHCNYHPLFLKHSIACLFFLCILSASCFAQLSNGTSKVNPLYVDPTSYDFSKNPPLLERVESGPHGYFRFINLQFSQEVCRRFRTSFEGTPPLNLHGDAHLEQYAVTDLGRGLTDFDDSSMGPAILDILRFGVSLRLACQTHGWIDNAERLFDAFLLGYRQALNNPDANAKEPVVVRRIRSGFEEEKQEFFEWVESQMLPISGSAQDSLHKAMQQYIDAMIADNPKLERNYFQLQQAGYLQMGIGSALDIKYLVRIRGASDDPMDDVVLEIKEVRDISGISCIIRTQKADPFRVLLGQARIAYAPFKHLGYFRFRRLTFWVHSWVENYKEVKIGKSFKTEDELAEVAHDVGLQLGHGHTRHIASPFDAQLKRSQLRLLSVTEPRIKRACIDLAKLTVEAWTTFRAGIETQ